MNRSFNIVRYSDGRLSPAQDLLSVEEPLLVLLNGKPFATLMRTPGEDQALTEGFLFSEGIIAKPEDVSNIEVRQHETSQEIRVELAPHCHPSETAPRSIYLSSSCGVCGRSSIEELTNRLEPIAPMDVSPEFLLGLLSSFIKGQRQFPLTGGVHAAALFDAEANLLSIEEDVGRHNALDKLIGKAFRAGDLPLSDCILLMSSRASFDIVQKAAMAGIPVLASMGAASSLAADLAKASGIALYCFLRGSSVVNLR